MDLQPLASTDAPALIRRLLTTRTSVSLRHLHALRDALDTAAREVEASAGAEEDLEAIAATLAAAAEAQVQRVRDDATRELLALRERMESLERDLALTVDAHAEVDAALRQAESESRRVTQERSSLAEDLNEARASADRLAAQTGDLQAELNRRAGEHADLHRQLALAAQVQEDRDARISSLEAGVREERAAREAALQDHLATADRLSDERTTMAAALAGSQARVQALEGTVAGLRAEAAHLQARLDDAFHTEGELRRQLASPAETAGPAGLEPDAHSLRQELERMVSLFDASARAVSEMAAASTSTELLHELVKRLSLQFSRVALFRLKGDRLESEGQVGFDDPAEMSKLILPTSVDSMITRAIGSGSLESLYGEDVAVRSGTPFGGAPTSAVVLPIVLHGTTIGVVYADDSDMPESARGPAVHQSSVGFARLLLGQVVVLLVRHTHELKTLAELRQYASTLLQEAREMHLADMESGKSPELLRSRLKENIDCASQLYTYRAAMEGTAAAALLDEQIAEALAADTPFARDLGAVAGRMVDPSSLIPDPGSVTANR